MPSRSKPFGNFLSTRTISLAGNQHPDSENKYAVGLDRSSSFISNNFPLFRKLLQNNEIQQDNKRHEYKEKFIQYINATNPCLSVFWVFDVHREGGDRSKFEKLKEEYRDLPHTLVLLTDCKCSSGIETGMSKNNLNNK